MPRDFMDDARMLAAQCWCDEETQSRVMDPELCEAVARRIAGWMQTAASHAESIDYYRGLLVQCAGNLGPLAHEANICDDGSVVDSPLLAKIPDLVKKLADRK